MTDTFRYLQNVWFNWDKIYLASPENLPLLFVGTPILFLCFLLTWRLKLKKRPEKTHTSRYSKLMDLKLWLGMISVYGLIALAITKPMIAKNSFETSLGPVEVTFIVDLSLSVHLKHFGSSGPTSLEVAKTQIQAIEPFLGPQDQASVIYFARSAHEAHPMFPLNQSIRPLFNRAVEEIKFPEKLNVITTYNPTLNFVDSSDIVSVLQETYKLYDKTQKIKDSKYTPDNAGNRLIFLFSDGDFVINPADARLEDEEKEIKDYRQSMFVALSELRKRGMRIYSVGIGSRTGVPLINALRKYKKGEDYTQDYEDSVIQKGLSKVFPSNLKLLVEGSGGDSSTDVIILGSLDANAREFMTRAIKSHRQGSQAKTVESRDDEPLWRSVVILAIVVATLSLAGWWVFIVCSLFLYIFGGFILSYVPITEWLEMLYSVIVSSFV